MAQQRDPFGLGIHVGRKVRPDLTADEEACLDALESQKRVTSWPYYSAVKFFAPRVGTPPGPYTYALAQGTQVRAFSYAVQQLMTSAGFTAADGNASIADTNLTQANQTTGGQNFLIHGLAIQLQGASLHLNDGQSGNRRVRLPDARFTGALFECVSVELSLNGDENRFRLGRIGMVPGAGGLTGDAYDAVGGLSFAGQGKTLAYPNNGWATRANYFRINEGLIWRNQSNSDANLNIIFTVNRPFVLSSGGEPEAQGALAGGIDIAQANAFDSEATAQNAYGYPTEVVLELMVFLIGQVIGPRSRSA